EHDDVHTLYRPQQNPLPHQIPAATSNNNKFENDLSHHLNKEAEEIREFPHRLRGRIREGIAPRARARMAPQLALAGALVLVAFAVLAVRSPQVILNDVRSTVTQIFTPQSPSPSPT